MRDDANAPSPFRHGSSGGDRGEGAGQYRVHPREQSIDRARAKLLAQPESQTPRPLKPDPLVVHATDDKSVFFEESTQGVDAEGVEMPWCIEADP